MAQTVLITLTIAGTDTGPFNLYSNVDGYLAAFESGISRLSLVSGYTSTLVPDAATTIRVKSMSTLCENYIDLGIVTTSTTSTSSTTTTSTTAPPTTTTTTTLAKFIVDTSLAAFTGGITWDSIFQNTLQTRAFNLTTIGNVGSNTLKNDGLGNLDGHANKTNNGGIAQDAGTINWKVNGITVNTVNFNLGDNVSNNLYTFTGLSAGDDLTIEIAEG